MKCPRCDEYVLKFEKGENFCRSCADDDYYFVWDFTLAWIAVNMVLVFLAIALHMSGQKGIFEKIKTDSHPLPPLIAAINQPFTPSNRRN